MTLKVTLSGILTIPSETAQAMKKVIETDTDDFGALLAIAGLDPAHDLQHGDWAGTNFGFVDISGWNLRGAKLDGADLSGVLNVDKAIFDSETSFDGTKLPPGVTVESLID